MPGLNIVEPTPNALVVPGQDFAVSGIAFDRGWPEPIAIDSVTVSVDGGPWIEAVLTAAPPSPQFAMNFRAQVRVAPIQGPHTILVSATNDRGKTVSKSVTVFVGVGPLSTAFAGTSTLKTTHPRDGGAHVAAITGRAEFSSDRGTVSFRLDPIHEVSNPQSSVLVTIDVTMDSSGVGVFVPSSGSLDIPVGLRFRVRVEFSTFLGNFTLSDTTSMLFLTLTTGSSTSPTGAFSDTGVPMNASGFVVLVGDGQFSGGVLNGRDGSLVIVGTVSPQP